MYPMIKIAGMLHIDTIYENLLSKNNVYFVGSRLSNIFKTNFEWQRIDQVDKMTESISKNIKKNYTAATR